jgi:hypothetical protein
VKRNLCHCQRLTSLTSHWQDVENGNLDWMPSRLGSPGITTTQLLACDPDYRRQWCNDSTLAIPSGPKSLLNGGGIGYLPPSECQIYCKYHWQIAMSRLEKAPMLESHSLILSGGSRGATNHGYHYGKRKSKTRRPTRNSRLQGCRCLTRIERC